MGQQQSSPSVPTVPTVPIVETKQIDVAAPATSGPMKGKTTTAAVPPVAEPVKSECPMRGKKDTSVASSEPPKSCPMNGSTADKKVGAAECPMKSKKEDTKPAESCDCGKNEKSAAPASTAVCPVKTEDGKYINPNVYNVYNQKIDPKNQMPATANQQPAAEQAVDLSVDRVQSSIPKGGTESTWLYPSPQMFWNALVRKNKTEGASEEDMDHVVRIHNSMNENTWNVIMEWERLHAVQGPGREPKLLRFLGRPQDYSPKARLKMLFGHVSPFDRHDWIVDRGGEEVRYVIDYYHDEAGAPLDQSPQHKSDFNSIKSIKIDVRPAIDSPQSIIDRIVLMPYQLLTGETRFKPMPFFPPSATVLAERRQQLQLKEMWQQVRERCEADKTRLMNCKTDQECANATIALQRCTASVACPSIAIAFDESVKAQPYEAEKAERAYQSMTKCLDLFEVDSRKAFRK